MSAVHVVPEENAGRASIHAVGMLDDPTRNSVYEFIAGSREPVTRDQVTYALGIKRSTAVFHLEQLVESGILEVTFHHDQSAHAGRPAKLYRRSDSAIEVSIPPHRYLLIAEVLLRALARTNTSALTECIHEAAVETGQRIGDDIAIGAGAEPTERLCRCLEQSGFEPYAADEGAIELGNCPFHALAQEFTEAVCSLNLSLIQGIVAGSKCQVYVPKLIPADGRCCVRLNLETSAGGSSRHDNGATNASLRH